MSEVHLTLYEKSSQFPSVVIMSYCLPLPMHVSKERSPSTMKHISAARPPDGLSLFFFPPFSFFVLPSFMKTNERPTIRAEVSSLSKRRNHSSAKRQVFRCPSLCPCMSPTFALVLQTKKSMIPLPSWEGESGKTIKPHSAP